MKTEKLFKQDVYLKSCEAFVTGVSEKGGKTVLTFDRTVFFPKGGGQSCDMGTINTSEVIDVLERDGVVYHVLKAENGEKECPVPSGKNPDFSVGDRAVLKINWDHRLDNMQRHCGEHILSGVFFELYGGVNRGFHMGDDYMTIDISLEGKQGFKKITWEMAKVAESRANQIVRENLPVITRHYASRAEAENLPLRKDLTIDEDITIVCVGDVSNPADCVACCGTHPSSSGQVGLIKIYKVEVNKGMSRIYFEAGRRAFSLYQKQYDVLATLENKLSAGFGDLLSKYETHEEKSSAARDELYHLKKYIVKCEISALKKAMDHDPASKEGAGPCFIKRYSSLSIGDLFEIGKALQDCIPAVVFLVHEPSKAVLLFSDKYDCGSLVKENASDCGGKGGGRKTNARAVFADPESLDAFIGAVIKHTE